MSLNPYWYECTTCMNAYLIYPLLEERWVLCDCRQTCQMRVSLKWPLLLGALLTAIRSLLLRRALPSHFWSNWFNGGLPPPRLPAGYYKPCQRSHLPIRCMVATPCSILYLFIIHKYIFICMYAYTFIYLYLFICMYAYTYLYLFACRPIHFTFAFYFDPLCYWHVGRFFSPVVDDLTVTI